MMFFEKFRQELVSYFSRKLREAEGEELGIADRLFPYLGLPHCTQKHRVAEYRQMVRALGGIPKDAAWHEFRIRKLYNTRSGVIDEFSRQIWLIDDAELFLRRHPENETVRFVLAELKLLRTGTVEIAIGVLDRIIEMNGTYLVEAYRRRGELLRKIDPVAAWQDFKKTVELKIFRGKQPPSSWKFKTPDAESCDFEMLPNLPEIPLKTIQNLIDGDDPGKMLDMIPDLRCPNLRQQLYCAAAERYFERNDPVHAKKLLAEALDMIRREKQSKSEVAHAMVDVARIQGKLFGRDEAKKLLDLALQENSRARWKDAQDLSLIKIIKGLIEFAFFDEAETLIRSRSGEQPEWLSLELADALTVAGEATKADALRQEYDEYWSGIDDRSALMPLLSLAESYTAANERDKARRALKNATDLAKYENYDFGLLTQTLCDHYIACGFLEEFKTDMSRYADREEIEYDLERIDRALRERHA